MIQLDHGILTYNSTSEYTWEKGFKPDTIETFNYFSQAHPNLESLKLEEIQLRYINAIMIPPSLSFFEFLEAKLNTKMIVPDKINTRPLFLS